MICDTRRFIQFKVFQLRTSLKSSYDRRWRGIDVELRWGGEKFTSMMSSRVLLVRAEHRPNPRNRRFGHRLGIIANTFEKRVWVELRKWIRSCFMKGVLVEWWAHGAYFRNKMRCVSGIRTWSEMDSKWRNWSLVTFRLRKGINISLVMSSARDAGHLSSNNGSHNSFIKVWAVGGAGQRTTNLRKFPQEIFVKELDVLRQIPQHNHLQRLKGSNSNATEGILELFGFLFILGFSPGIIPFKEDVECLDEHTLVLLGNIGELALQLMLLEEGVVCILLKPFDEFLLGYFLQFSTVPWSFPLAVSSFRFVISSEGEGFRVSSLCHFLEVGIYKNHAFKSRWDTERFYIPMFVVTFLAFSPPHHSLALFPWSVSLVLLWIPLAIPLSLFLFFCSFYPSQTASLDE